MAKTYNAIGFANTYYTLWFVEEYRTQIDSARFMDVVKYRYIKNISKDKDKAFAKHPDAEFIEDLRGKRQSFEKTQVVWTNDTFHFGKYYGQPIAECTDLSYLAWYWDHVYGEARDYVTAVLEKHGYQVRNFSLSKDSSLDELVSPEFIANEAEDHARVMEMIKDLESKPALEATLETNLSYTGGYVNISEFKTLDLIYRFPEVKEMYYNGYAYYVPVQDGKAKRIKNKPIMITDYDIEPKFERGEVEIKIKRFELKK